MLSDLEKTVKIGIEITFSNSDFDYFQLLDKTDDKKKFKDPKFKDFCNKLSIKNSNYEEYVKYLHETYIVGWKTKIDEVTKKNKFFKKFFTQNNADDTKPLKGTEGILNVKSNALKQLRVECELTGNVNTNDDTYDYNMTGKFEKWYFNIDFDEGCIEVHAKAMTYEGYLNYGYVIKNIIYGIAKQLNLKAGYAGKGAGHLNIDMMTGFNSHIDVIKTVLLFEIMQSKIDRCYDLIDVSDNVNAPYFFDSSRKEFNTVKNIYEKEQKKQEKPDNLGEIMFTAQEMSFLYYNKDDEVKLINSLSNNVKESIRRWFISVLKEKNLVVGKKIDELKVALKKQMTESQQDKSVTKNISESPLHYQAVNLQHIKQGDSGSRVEFRRFVSQRSHAELKTTMQFLLRLISVAKNLETNNFISVLEKNIGLAIMQQSTMNEIQKLAKNES